MEWERLVRLFVLTYPLTRHLSLGSCCGCPCHNRSQIDRSTTKVAPFLVRAYSLEYSVA